jgi:hypothetical protein
MTFARIAPVVLLKSVWHCKSSLNNQMQLITRKGTALLALSAAIAIIFLNSCATKINFLASPVVPGAEGTVKVKLDNNNNYGIKISMNNLAEPNKLLPAKNLYIVWMETQGEGIKNIGQINSSTSLIMRKLTASFETVSSLKPNKIFITAENEAGIQVPGDQVILSTTKF